MQNQNEENFTDEINDKRSIRLKCTSHVARDSHTAQVIIIGVASTGIGHSFFFFFFMYLFRKKIKHTQQVVILWPNKNKKICIFWVHESLSLPNDHCQMTNGQICRRM